MKTENIDKIASELLSDKVNWERTGKNKFNQLLERINEEVKFELSKKRKTLDLNSDLLNSYDSETRKEIEDLLKEDKDLLIQEEEKNYTAQVNEDDFFLDY